MSAITYEALRKRIADFLTKQFVFDPEQLPADECFTEADFVLDEVYRSLETVTPEMERAVGAYRRLPRPTWLAMLRASPLNPERPQASMTETGR